MKGKLTVYEKCVPTIDVEGLQKQLDQDELICRAAVEQATDSLQKVKADLIKFMKKWQEEF